MRATLIYGAHDVRSEEIPDARIQSPTDAVIRILRSCICGSDLHRYNAMPATVVGVSIGHECLGIVEELGSDVTGLRRGDLVVSPFSYSDGECDFCLEGLTSSCRHGGFYGHGRDGASGMQAEAARIPLADTTLVKLGVAEDSELLSGLLTLADVLPTGHHAAVVARVGPRTSVTVIGDGAVGLCAVIAAKRLGAERIILMGRHDDRLELGRDFGATDLVPERGDEGVKRVRELTRGDGTHAVLECVGHLDAYEQALGVVRAGGIIGRVGVPQYEVGPIGINTMFMRNITLSGGPAPVRAYIDELLPEILDGSLLAGKVFDLSLPLESAPEGYRAMANRRALKVMLTP